MLPDHIEEKSDAITLYSRMIRQELDKLRAINGALPFAVLTILIELEMNAPLEAQFDAGIQKMLGDPRRGTSPRQ